jgi:hypothetical protein
MPIEYRRKRHSQRIENCHTRLVEVALIARNGQKPVPALESRHELKADGDQPGSGNEAVLVCSEGDRGV